MKTLSFPQLLFAGLGALLVWAAITGQSPPQILKNAFAKAGSPAVSTNTEGSRIATKSNIAPTGGPGKAAI